MSLVPQPPASLLSENIAKKDKRHALFRQQREQRGFDDTELWDLDTTLVRYLLWLRKGKSLRLSAAARRAFAAYESSHRNPDNEKAVNSALEEVFSLAAKNRELALALQQFMVPRLTAYGFNANGKPAAFSSEEAWGEAVREMVAMFADLPWMSSGTFHLRAVHAERINLFIRHFSSLWD